MNKLRLVLIFSICMAIFVHIEAVEQSQIQIKNYNILAIFSTTASSEVRMKLSEGFSSSLKEQVYSCSLDAWELSNVNTHSQLEEFDYYLKNIKNRDYDLVVVFSNFAANIVGQRLNEFPKDVPVLFTNISKIDENWQKVHPKLSIISRSNSLEPNLKLAQRLFPANHNIYVLTSHSDWNEARTEAVRAKYGDKLNFHILYFDEKQPGSMEEMELALANAPKDSVLLMHEWEFLVSNYKNRDIYWEKFYKAFKGPIFVRRGVFLDNAIGGFLVQLEDIGKMTWDIAVQLLNGDMPKENISRQGAPKLVFNDAELRKFKIKKDLLPLQANIVNAPLDWTEGHLKIKSIFGVLCLVGILLIFSLLFCLVKAWKKIRRIEAIHQALPVQILILNRAGKVLFFNGSNFGKSNRNKGDDQHLEELGWVKQKKISDAIRKVLETKNPSVIDYNLYGSRRSVTFSVLDTDIFGEDAVVSILQGASYLQDESIETKELAKHFVSTLQSITEPVIITDKEQTITMINDEALKIVNCYQNDVIERKFDEIFGNIAEYPEAPSILTIALADKVKTSLSKILFFVNNDSQEYYLNYTAIPILDDENNVIGGMVIINNQTNAFRQQRELEINQNLLKEISKKIKLSLFRYDLKSQVYMNFGGKLNLRLNNRTRQVIDDGVINFASSELMQQNYRDILDGKIDEIDIQIVTEIGNTQRYYRLFGIRIANNSSEIIGILIDINEKVVEHNNYIDVLSLLKAIMDNADSAITIRDINNSYRYVDCNKFFEEQIGVSKVDIIGKTDYEVLPNPVDADNFLQNNRKLLEQSEGQMIFNESYTLHDKSIFDATVYKQIIQKKSGENLLLTISSASQKFEDKKKIKTIEDNSSNDNIAYIEQLNSCLSQIILEHTLEFAANSLLRLLGTNCKSLRTYIMERHEDKLQLVYEWSVTGKTSEPDTYTINMRQELLELLNGRQAIILDAKNQDSAKMLPLSHNANTGAMIGLIDHGKMKWTLGVEFAEDDKVITPEEIRQLRQIGSIYLLALERKQQTEKIKEHLKLQDTLFEKFGIAIAVFDDKQNCIFANEAFKAYSNTQNRDISGIQCMNFCVFNDNEACRQKSCPLAYAITNNREHFMHAKFDGKEIRIQAAPLCDNDERNQYYMVSIIDLSLEHQALKEKEQIIEQDKMIAKFMEYIIKGKDMNAVLDQILMDLSNSYDGQLVGCVKYVIGENPRLEQHIKFGKRIQSDAPRVVLSRNDFFEAFKRLSEGHSIFYTRNQVPELERADYQNEVEEYFSEGDMTIIAVPLFLNDEFWGVLWTKNSVDCKPLTEIDLRMFNSIAWVIEVLLEHEFQKEQLNAENNLHEQIFNSSQGALMMLDVTKKIVAMNDAFADLLGVNANDLINQTCKDYCIAANNPQYCNVEVCPFMKSLEYEIECELEYTFNDKVIKFSSKPIIGLDGKLLYVLESAIDVTETKTYQAKLEQQRAELELFNSQLKLFVEQDKVINHCLEVLVKDDDYAAGFKYMVDMIGKQMKSGCTLILQYFEQGEDSYFLRRESWDENADRAHLKEVSNIPEKNYAYVYSYLKSGAIIHESLHVKLNKDAPKWKSEVYDYLIKTGQYEIILMPIKCNHKFWGYIGTEHDVEDYHFGSAGARMISSAARVFEIMLERDDHRKVVSLAEMEKKLIINMLPIPIMLIDNELKILNVNPATCQMVKKLEIDLLQKSCKDIFCQSDDLAQVCLVELTIKTAEPQSGERIFDNRPYLINTLPIIENGKVVKVLQSMLDVSEMHRSKNLLREAAKKAENASKSKSVFLASVSREIGAPLSKMLDLTQLLQTEDLATIKRDEHLKTLEKLGHNLLHFVNEILELSSVDSSQIKFKLEPVKFGEILQQLNVKFAQVASDKHLNFKVNTIGMVPDMLLDKAHLEQVLAYLISNSIELTKSGGVNVLACWEKISNERGNLIITIKDTGIGIPDSQKQFIFDPFSAERYSSNNLNSSSLELAIASGLIQKMNGVITLDSEENKGSCFTIKLNTTMIKPKKIYPNGETKTKRLPLPEDEFSVLVVDDVPMNVKVLATMLTKCGCVCHTALSGMEALEKLEKITPHAVFTDLWMPEMNGVEFARKIREHDELFDIPLIAVTADAENAANFDISYFYDVLLKPVTILKLRQVLEQLKASGVSS